MMCSPHPRPSRVAVLLILIACAFGGRAAHAQLTLLVDQLNPSAAAGDTLNFTGVITNQTGLSLSSTDFFFNFFNYDPDSLTPQQVLGTTPFTLPNNTFSANTALFSIVVSPGVLTSSQSLGVTLEDVNGDISNEVNISANVTAKVVPVSEPGPLLLLAGGLIAICGPRFLGEWRRKRLRAYPQGGSSLGIGHVAPVRWEVR